MRLVAEDERRLRSRGRLTPPEHAVALHEQHLVAVLVEHLPAGAHQTHVRPFAHGPLFQNGVLQAQRVAGEHRFEPLQAVQSG